MDDHATAQAEQGSDDAARLRRALRASLRLIFEPNLADRLAAADGDPPDLRRVVRLATRQYRLLQLQNTLFPHRHHSSTSGAAPLAARLSLGPRAALGLA